jgi:hypothetical protein
VPLTIPPSALTSLSDMAKNNQPCMFPKHLNRQLQYNASRSFYWKYPKWNECIAPIRSTIGFDE